MEIARQNNIRLEWSIGTWGENLERTRNGEIDLMIGLIYTEERDAFLDFGKEAVMSTWSQVFQAAEGDVNSILDIEGRRIGMVSGDQNAKGFVNWRRVSILITRRSSIRILSRSIRIW